MTGLTLQWRAGRPPLALRWRGDDGSVTTAVDQRRPLPAVATMIGKPGRDGADSPPVASLVASVDVVRGMPLAIDRTTRQLVPAVASFYPLAFVVGLALDDAGAGFVAQAKGTGTIERLDWTPIAGTASLTPGVPYFLADGGGITTTRPTAAGSSSALIGEAITAQILDIRRSPPILL